MTHKTLILSIALNGYQLMYRDELKSHKQYANKYGYSHQAIKHPFVSRLGVECCWLKLTLIHNALLSGYERVFFLDADALVKHNCPPLTEVIEDGKCVYMAKGYSNRLNSGVILALNNQKTIDWLETIINARGHKVQPQNDVGWGENGHVIEYSKGVNFIKELKPEWNNTSISDLKDYIRHRNFGPMRQKALNKFFHKVVFYLSAKYLAYLTKKSPPTYNALHNEELIQETNTILSLYPMLTYSQN